mmetsp:Transcript_3195/g.7530  ORF Transcript_3195/g.7530 Transcript_3195/m.7530 type:complete len:331 (+) Transcript_3195:305-1297(+)|eukprot:CAMPEP_0178995396 /NCGR_PEP_ID=MMETSP0795-20121207/7807_1 /TAXON_ID=88552 /ORGANISM="Amoebophrya sp., Strain Ameob2" /LENGTH=330 /DNA_ID=CAMNT_0020687705 /DNA_START=240 /DNA_END=1232 /DNA_ORIENTATION=-
MPRRRGANADAKAANQNHEDSDDDIPTLGRGEQRGCDRGVEGKAFKICEHCHRPFTWRKKWERCWDEVRTCSNACKRERKKVARKEVGVGAQAELPGDEGGEVAEQEQIQEEETVTEDGSLDAPAKERHRPWDGELHEDRGDTTQSPLHSANNAHQKAGDRKRRAKGKNFNSSSPGSTSHEQRTKKCDVCGEEVQLAYRCRWDAGKVWRFVCRPCWPLISHQEYLEKAATGSAKSGLSPPTNTTSTTSFSFPTQHTLVGILGNPYYVYGGTWKATIGLTKKEILGSSNTLTQETSRISRAAPAVGAAPPEMEEQIDIETSNVVLVGEDGV